MAVLHRMLHMTVLIAYRVGTRHILTHVDVHHRFVAKLREMKTDDNMLLLKMDIGAGTFVLKLTVRSAA